MAPAPACFYQAIICQGNMFLGRVRNLSFQEIVSLSTFRTEPNRKFSFFVLRKEKSWFYLGNFLHQFLS